MKNYILVSSFLLAVGACGGSLEPGTAEIDGQVAGSTIAPQTAFLTVHPLIPEEVLIMAEDSSLDCDLQDLAFDGLVAVIGFPCGPAMATTYTLGEPPGEFECVPSNQALMVVEGFADVSEYDALTGSLTITERDSAVISGSFDGDFGEYGALSGEFVAKVCPRSGGS